MLKVDSFLTNMYVLIIIRDINFIFDELFAQLSHYARPDFNDEFGTSCLEHFNIFTCAIFINQYDLIAQYVDK